MKEIIIGKRKIGVGHSTFIIAELSGNHHQDMKQALALIDVAVEAGVDAVKSQTYTADTITLNSDKELFQVKVNDSWKGQTLYGLYKQAFTPWEWLPKLKDYAESKGLLFFTSVFDPTSVDFMEKMGVLFYKVASFEVVDIPLLEKIGQTKKPVIISRGMATDEELELALVTLRKNGTPSIAILHCVSSYPAKPEEMNLSTIADLAKHFDVPTGLSNHCIDNKTDELAVAAGACIIEKHITLNRSDGGPDASFSLEPAELKDLVKRVRETETILGTPQSKAGGKESENVVFRKSLFTSCSIKKGEKFTEKNVRSVRPGNGLAPKFYHEVLEKIASRDIEFAEPIDWSMIVK
ncbi:MAG: pseudaminic acid synthase [Candidatus Taylorbacteria bacterium]|nr:pseudaminic acid synthase [Candidatus Taylorbacteria bacterium]